MKQLRKSFFLVIVFSLIASFSIAQVKIEKSENIMNIGGQQYYVHMIKAKQTLYSISKEYKVSESEILRINPDAANGLDIGQILKIPLVIESVDQLNFKNGKSKILYHKVKHLENLMAVSRRYDVSMSNLITLNPGAEVKIRKGQLLRIPTRGILAAYDTLDLIKANDTIIVHWVMKKETLFKLSRQYGVSIPTINKYNPEIEAIGLKFDQFVIIPHYIGPEIIPAVIVSATELEDSSFSKPCRNVLINPTYEISLFLPLYLSQLFEIEYSKSDEFVFEGQFVPFQYVQYMEGAKMAMDSLAGKGMKCNFRIVDTKSYDFIHHRDRILREHRDADLIFGPVDKEDAQLLSEFAKRHKIWFVNHWNTYLDTTNNNPYLINTTPTPPDQFSNIIGLIDESFKNSNIIVVASSNNNQLYSYAKSFYEQLSAHYADNWEKPSLNFVSIGSEGSSAAFERIQGSKQNTVIAFTSGEAFTSKFISELYKTAKKKDVVLVGMPWWKNYRTLDNSYLNHLKTHLFSTSFINYESEDVTNFIKSYRKSYRTEPDYTNNRSFEGFDVTYFFGNLLLGHGKRFRTCLSHYESNMYHTKFQFEVNPDNSNLDNKYINIYRYEDFKLLLEE